MIGMPTINSIRQLRRDGLSITDIASATGVSRDTVYKFQSSAPRIEMGRPLHDGIYILGRRRRRARRNRRGVAFERLVAQRGAVGFGSVGRPAEGHGGHDVHARSHHVGRFHAVVAERGELP